MGIAGEYCGKKYVRGFVELRSRSNGAWTEATGCATEGDICTCAPAPNRRSVPQVLPAYGLQDLRNEHRNPKTKANPNTMCLQSTLGGDHGSGHFYLAENRTFLLCVDKTIGETTNRNSGRPQEGRTRTAKKGIIEFVRGAVKVVNQDLRGQALYGAWASAEADKAACGPTFLRRVVFTCGRSY